MALSVSMILFVSMSGLKEIADGVQEYMTFDYGYSVVADYTANRKYTTNRKPVGGRNMHRYDQAQSLQRKSCQSFQNIKEQRYMEVEWIMQLTILL